MPPKAKKLSDAEAENLILKTFQEQNRPANHTLLHATLHGAASKTQCVNLMDTLAEKGKLVKKEFGKAKVYWASQEHLESVPPEKLKELDKEIEGKREQVKALTSALSASKSELTSIQSSDTTEDILLDIERLKAENAKLEEKKEVLAVAAETTDEKDLEVLQKRLDFTETTWRKRRKQCLSILDTIGSGMGKKPSEMIEELGLETDEEFGVTVPPAKRQKLR